jgi:3-oxoacyl-[acyl-carrier protein] reductase
MDLGLQDKTALVTGSSRGIGRAAAKALAAEGAVVTVIARGAIEVESVVEEIRQGGGRAHGLVADVATRAGAHQAVEDAVRQMGGLDILVNNVGGSTGAGPFDSADEDTWERVVDANLMSAVWCSRAALEPFTARGGGTIVHVTSICGLEYCGSAPYTAAKGALASLTKEMAVDLAHRKVRVVAVAPGSILFPGGSWDRRRISTPEKIEKMIAEELPWGRFGTPEEVADVIAFVASPRASWITGSSVVVDGAQGRRV